MYLNQVLLMLSLYSWSTRTNSISKTHRRRDVWLIPIKYILLNIVRVRKEYGFVVLISLMIIPHWLVLQIELYMCISAVMSSKSHFIVEFVISETLLTHLVFYSVSFAWSSNSNRRVKYTYRDEMWKTLKWKKGCRALYLLPYSDILIFVYF